MATEQPAKPNNQGNPAPALAQQLGLFTIAAATLLLQVSWTRVLSVSLWYHFAFLVISTAMLGFGFSGVVLTLSKRAAAAPLERSLPSYALAFVITTVLGFVLANQLPFAPFSLLEDSKQLWVAPLFLVCIATPFVFSGLVAAQLLSARPAHAGTIYFFDLLGAGVGCFAVVWVMRAGGSTAIVVAGALGALAALLFCSTNLLRVVAALLLGGALLLAFQAETWLPLRISHTKRVGKTPMQDILRGPSNLHTAWDSSSRIDVLPARFGRSILIDAGTAMTRMPRVTRPPQRMGNIRDERQLVLRAGGRQSVLIIGSGGGWEVLAALRQGARRVVAVEVNPLITALVSGEMASFIGRIFAHPAVSLHTAEARSFIRRSKERYDVIMASHTISNAAAASGALSLSENYVLTQEAFADYLSHLTPGGLLFFSRPENQLLRLVATCASAMHEARIKDPAQHIVVFAGGRKPSFYGAMIASMTPLTDTYLREVATVLRQRRLRPLYLPRHQGNDPAHVQLLTAKHSELSQLYRGSDRQLAPAVDDTPFFNQRHRFSDISLAHVGQVFRQSQRGRMALEDKPIAEVVLLVVLLQATLLALAFVVLPLWLKRRWGLAGSGRYLLYFLALGLAFILVEIALIQRLTLFIGQPVHAFAVVVGTLLVASGIGSLLSHRLVTDDSRLIGRLKLALLVVAAAIGLFAVASPHLVGWALGASLPMRIGLAIAMVTPMGLAMGMPFPLGLRHAGSTLPAVIPWAWGLNAVASVVGSVLAIILATSVGFSGVFYVAALVYLSAVFLWKNEPGQAP